VRERREENGYFDVYVGMFACSFFTRLCLVYCQNGWIYHWENI